MSVREIKNGQTCYFFRSSIDYEQVPNTSKGEYCTREGRGRRKSRELITTQSFGNCITMGVLTLLIISVVLVVESVASQCRPTPIHCDVGPTCGSWATCGRGVCLGGPAPYIGADCSISRWTLVYEHDTDGSVMYGRREDLDEAVRAGAALTVYIPRSQHTIQAEHVHFEDGQVCAQFWKHGSFSGRVAFQTNVYWWILIVCTSGYGQATRYYVGGGHFVDTDFTYRIQWYVKYPYKLLPVLKMDAAGRVESGSVAALRKAVRNGKAMYALMSDGTTSDLLPLTNVAIRQSQVTAQSINRVSLKACDAGRCPFTDSAVWLSYLLSSARSDVVVTRREVDSAVRRADVHQQAAISWLVDDCWQLALVHDGHGTASQGNLGRLQDAVRAGHRVRVRLPGLQDNVAEADGLQIKNGVVSGYFLTYISDDNGALPDIAPAQVTHAVWMTVSTSGIVRMRRQKLGSIEKGRTTRRAFDCVMWFVDTRPWTLTLSVSAAGTVEGGSKLALVAAVERGATVRYSVRVSTDQLTSVGVDNLHIYQKDVIAQNTFSMSMAPAADDANEIDFMDNPYWDLTIVTTTGRYETSRWTYGKHESRTRDVKNVAVDWFVLY